MALPKTFIDMPANMTASDPEFIRVLNDRLRRAAENVPTPVVSKQASIVLPAAAAGAVKVKIAYNA